MMKFFHSSVLGIDIADQSLQIVEIEEKGSGFVVSRYNRIEIPQGAVLDGTPVDIKKLAQLLQQALKTAKPKAITQTKGRFFLPENQTFIVNAQLSLKEKAVWDAKISELAEEKVPHPIDDLVVSYAIKNQSSKAADVQIAAVKKKSFQLWQQVFDQAGIEIDEFDIEVNADARGIFDVLPKEPICLLDMGKRSSSVGFFDEHGLAYSYSSPIAGDYLTQALASKMKITSEEAEDLKQRNGLKSGKGEAGKVSGILTEELSVLINDIHNSLSYFFQLTGKHPSAIIMLGGTAQMTGISDLFAKELAIKVLPADPSKLFNLPKTIKEQDKFIGALGAARGALDPFFKYQVVIKAESKSLFAKAKPQAKAMPSEEAAEISSEPAALPVAKQPTQSSWFRSHRRESVLLGILLVSLLALSMVFILGIGRRNQTVEDLTQRLSSFKEPARIQVRLPLVISTQLLGGSSVRASILTKTWDPSSSSPAINAEKLRQETSLASGLRLWDQPIRVSDQKGVLTAEQISLLAEGKNPENLAYPLQVDWLVISDLDARSAALTLLKNALADNQFLFDSMEYVAIEPGPQPQSYILTLMLDITATYPVTLESPLSAPELAPAAPEEQPEKPAEEAVSAEPSGSESTAPVPDLKQTVTISASPIGYVNVRQAPSTAATIVGRVLPGETYELLEVGSGWYRILWGDGVEGWISSTYATQGR